jgi:hypothetical protein
MSTIDPSPITARVADWRPRVGWASTLRAPYEALASGARGLDAVAAWCDVAMMMGDTGAPELALVVCLHAEAELPEGFDHRRLAAHRDLCLLDLRLTRTTAPGPFRLAEIGNPGVVEDHPGELAAWLARALVPWGGDLARAAHHALRVAAVRTGVIDGPDPGYGAAES